jgi:transposase-like protein
MVAKRSYSDDERASALAALDANGGDVAHTARQIGIPRKTISEWANGRVHPDVANARLEKKECLADRLEVVARQLVDLIPEKAKDAELREVAVAFGIAVDKMRLLREQPTTISRSADLTDEERLARLKQLAERTISRRPVTADSNGAG